MPSPLTGQVVAPLQFLEAQAALAQGWAVVLPDHQGPNAAYAAGPVPAGAGCATHDVESMALDEKTWPVWSSIVGDTIASPLGQPIGT